MTRRAIALVSVLVVLTLAALAGTTAMVVADASVSSARTTLHRAQARALAWSGVQAAMQELAEQREDLLLGGDPSLTAQWTLFESGEGRGIVRLVQMPEGEVAASECAKLDVNAATEEGLGELEMIGKDLAAKILEARKDRPFSSPESLMRVPGMTADVLYGTSEGSTDDGRSRESVSGLLDFVTTFGYDPNIQCGLGQDGSEHRGKLRININSEWTDDLGEAVADRFGQPAADALKQFMQGGETYKKDADIIKKMIGLKVPATEWAPILDALTTSDEPYLLGRVDLMRAPEVVLACVPGIDAAAAAAIVSARERLDEVARLTTTWIVDQEIITPEQFAQAVDGLTTRSTVWRIRVEAGVAPPDADPSDEPVLSDRVVLDAVIDVSSERPRVAYLRDVTALAVALKLRGELPEPETETVEPEPEPEPVEPADPQPRTRPSSPSPDRPATPPGPAPSSRGDSPPDRDGEKDGAPPPPKPPGKPTGSGPDRRRGRWTTGLEKSGDNP